jgi:tetratricopeptide (TPR) repeat protein
VALSAAIYIPTCKGTFVWDDAIVVTQQIVAFKDLGQVFFPPDHIPQWGQNYYRPMIVLTYLLDNRLFGPSPAGGHISNIVFHSAVVFFVWLFAYQCLQRFPFGLWGAVFAACVFAVHPIHTESVSWITGRSDTVAALFMVPGLAAAHHYWNHKKTWALLLSPVLYLLALLSKEVALSALLVLPFIFLLTPIRTSPDDAQSRNDVLPAPPAKKPKAVKSKPAAPYTAKPRAEVSVFLVLFVPFAAATVLYFLLRHHALVGHGSSLGLGPGEIISRFWRAVGYYTMKVVVPPPQLHFVTWTALPGLLASTLIITAAAGVMGYMARYWKDTSLLVTFTVIWFLCTLAPSLPIAMAKISEAPVAERYLFLPSVGLSVFLGGLFCLAAGLRYGKKLFVAGAVLLVGFYSAGTLHRNRVWQDDVRLWSDAVEKVPDQGLPWTELGMAQTARNDLDGARLSFEKAVAVDYDSEGRSIAYNNLGMIHLRRQDLEKAEGYFKKSIQERQTYPTPYYGLGLIGLERSRKDLPREQAKQEGRHAADAFMKAIKLNPTYTKALWGLVQSYVVLGDIATAEGNPSEADRNYRSAAKTFDDITRIDGQFVSQHPEKAAFIEQIKKRRQAEL